MFNQQFRLFAICISFLLYSPALSLADGYRLVTPPSANKEAVESMLQVVRTEIPRAAVLTKTERKVFHRLVAGRFNDMASAIRLRSDLAKKDIPSLIMQSKNRFRVIISSFLSEHLALLEQSRLAGIQIKTNIVKVDQSSPTWQIHSVDSYELRDAVYTASIMTTKDVITTIE